MRDKRSVANIMDESTSADSTLELELQHAKSRRRRQRHQQKVAGNDFPVSSEAVRQVSISTSFIIILLAAFCINLLFVAFVYLKLVRVIKKRKLSKKAATKAELRQSFSTCVYCMRFRFQSDYLGLSQPR